jgi:CrcB protein
MNAYHLLAVGIGGMIGSVARYITSKTIDEKLGAVFPYGTLTVNIAGSLILGILYGLTFRKAGMTDEWRLFLGPGLCGGFTTFSSFALENFTLLHQRPLVAVLYISATLIAGLLALAAGVFAGRAL